MRLRQVCYFCFTSRDARPQWGSVVVRLSTAGRLARDDELAARRWSADYLRRSEQRL